jgi:hypothetical protein
MALDVMIAQGSCRSAEECTRFTEAAIEITTCALAVVALELRARLSRW